MTQTIDRSTSAAERPLDGPLLTFDLPALRAQLKREHAWQTGSRNGITLLKTDRLRVVLVAMHAGTEIPPHKAEGPLAVEIVDGTLKFTAGAQEVSLSQGQLLTLQSGMPHGLHAVTECSFLLTIAADAAHPAE
ncbi:MAG: cupin domain-containing protein [Candidatus Binatia bacterium]